MRRMDLFRAVFLYFMMAPRNQVMSKRRARIYKTPRDGADEKRRGPIPDRFPAPPVSSTAGRARRGEWTQNLGRPRSSCRVSGKSAVPAGARVCPVTAFLANRAKVVLKTRALRPACLA